VREMQRVALRICTGLLNETNQVHDAVNFLLVMRAKGFLEKHLVDFRYLIPLVTVDANLVDQILKEAQPEEIEQLLERLDSSHLSDDHLRVLELIARLKNERKREVLVNNVGVLTRQLLSDEFKEGQLNLIAALFPSIATDSDRSQSMVLLGLSILNRAYPIETIKRLEVVYDLLFSALRHCSFAVLHQPVAIYGCHLSGLLTASQNLIPKMSLKEAEQWRHRLAKLCQLVAIHKPHFARIAPMIIGECLENGRETEDALLVLLGMCDKYGMAMMSANLSIGYKHRLSTLYNQFKKVNQVVV